MTDAKMKGLRERLHDTIAIKFNKYFESIDNWSLSHAGFKYKLSYSPNDHMFMLLTTSGDKEIVVRFKFNFSLKFYDIGQRDQ